MKISRREFIKRVFALGGTLLFSSSPLFAIPVKLKGEWEPAYVKLERQGKFSERIEEAYSIFESCRLCPRECGVNRAGGQQGFCRGRFKVVVFSAHPHFGEEIPLVGYHGSGTIFFSNCNLRCIFCQNWPIAHEGKGNKIEDEELAELMLHLQSIGCHNINLVTPTHVMPNIINATRIALKKGLRLPLVYNTSGYERIEILKILDGIVDIYLPDYKYTDPKMAAKYSSNAWNYPEITGKAIKEMHRQAGVLKVDSSGIAKGGLMIRHLVMPNRVAGTEEFIKWVAKNLPRNTYVNIMSQYRVEYRAYEYPEIARSITVDEFVESVEWAYKYGLTNLDQHTIMTYQFYKKRVKT